MKRRLSTILFVFCGAMLFAGVTPVSSSIGKIAVAIEKDSPEEMVQKAFTSSFTEDWLSTYALEKPTFAVAYAEQLSSLLPMENIIVSCFDGNQVSVRSLQSGAKVTAIIKEGRIAALSFD